MQELQESLAGLQEKYGSLNEIASTWMETEHADINSRIANVQNIQPNEIANNREEAILSAFDYVDAIKEALQDNKLTAAELSNIAQLGANAKASLDAFGGRNMKSFGASIDDITLKLAGGNIPQAKAGLGNMENALGKRPSKPSRP